MRKSAIKAAIIITMYSILGLFLGTLAYIFISHPITKAVDIITNTLTHIDILTKMIVASLLTKMIDLPIITFIIFIFFLSLGFASNLSIPTSGGVSKAEEISFEGVLEEEPKKAKKEKKKKEKKHEHKHEHVHTEGGAQQEQPVVDTGNYCQICGKPIPLGRAICKECEEALKRGEIPMSFNVRGGTTQQETE